MLEHEDLHTLAQIESVITELDHAVCSFETVIGRPIYVGEGEVGRFTYPSRSPQVVIVLKAVRVVSGLNALAGLLRIGHTVEMGVILRTVDDFLGDMMFVEEALKTGEPNAAQRRFMDEFFAGEMFSVEDMIATHGKDLPRVSRQKVQASEARTLGAFADQGPDRVRRISGTIDAALSAYVHGSFATTMELYEGGDREGFMLKGTFGSPHIKTSLRELARYVHRSVGIFANVALTFGLVDRAAGLLALHHRLRESPSFRREG